MKRVNLFIKYAINNILIFSVPFLFFFLFYYVSYKSTQDQIDLIVEGELNRSVESYQKLFNDINTMFIQLTMDYQVNHYLGIQGDIEGVSFYNLKDISLKLAPYVHSNPLLSHVILYLDKSRFIVYENGFYRLDNFYGSLYKGGGSLPEWIDQIRDKDKNISLISQKNITMENRTFDGHYYIKSIGSSRYYRGAIISIINDDDLKSLLTVLPSHYGGCFFVEGPEGIITSSTETESLFNEGILKRTSTGYTLGQGNYKLYRKMTDQGITFTAVLDKGRIFSDLNRLKRTGLLLLSLTFFMSLLISFFLARTNSKPINRIFQMILPEADRVFHEISLYEKVETALLETSDRFDRLETEVLEKKKILRPYVLQKLVSGEYKSRDILKEELNEAGINLENKPHCIITCRIPDIYLTEEQHNPRNRYALLAAALERNLNDGDYRIHTALNGLTALIALPDKEIYRAHCSELVHNVLSNLNKGDQREICFGISRVCFDLFQISQSFRESLDSMAVQPHEASSRISFYEDYVWDSSHYIYPINSEQDLIRAVMTGNTELIRSIHLSLRTDNFETRNLTLRELNNLFIQMQGTLIRLITTLPAEDNSDWDGRVKEWSSLSGSLERWDLLLDLLISISLIYESGKKSHNEALIEEVNRFIQKNYMNPDMGLAMIAERFGISENYLSNLYKEQTTQRISVYIQRVRMDRARNLLGEKGITVNDASLQCGYLNVSSFRRAFKRETGLSPNQFRN